MHHKNKIWNIALTACVLAGSTFGLLLHYNNNKPHTKDQITRLFEPISSRYGIKIVYEVGDNFLSLLDNPIVPAGPDRSSKVTPIKHQVLVRYPDILQKSFEKYPVHVIKKYLKAIYFAGEIDTYGIKCSGSYDPFRHIIYLIDNGLKDQNAAMKTFHHEFSSLLLLGNSFFLNPWEEQNPQEFNYLYEKFGDLINLKKHMKITLMGNEKDYEKGFMNIYGQTDFENDFNEYSAMIFTYPEKFKKIMNQYPRVRGKFLVWLEFYHNIDPIFTEEYLLGE